VACGRDDRRGFGFRDWTVLRDPVALTSLIKGQLHSSVLFWVVEGIVRTAIFLGYMLLLSRCATCDACLSTTARAQDDLLLRGRSAADASEREALLALHPRCGTSFLLVVMIVAIFVFAPIGLPAWYWLVATRILGVPVIAGSPSS